MRKDHAAWKSGVLNEDWMCYPSGFICNWALNCGFVYTVIFPHCWLHSDRRNIKEDCGQSLTLPISYKMFQKELRFVRFIFYCNFEMIQSTTFKNENNSSSVIFFPLQLSTAHFLWDLEVNPIAFSGFCAAGIIFMKDNIYPAYYHSLITIMFLKHKLRTVFLHLKCRENYGCIKSFVELDEKSEFQ